MVEFSDSDPKSVWQNQPREDDDMSLKLLLAEAQKLGARARRNLVLPVSLTIVTAVTMLYLYFTRPLPATTVIIGSLVLLLVLAQAGRRVYTAYQIHKWVWPGTLTTELALTSSMNFYRVELERRYREAVRRSRPWVIVLFGAGLVLPLLYASLYGGRSPQNLAPFVFIVLVWMEFSLYTRKRDARKIRRELDELDEFEKGGPPEGSE
jgi:hypothetical protein